MADGTVKIGVELDDSKAKSQSNKAGNQIAKGVESGLNRTSKSANKMSADVSRASSSAARAVSEVGKSGNTASSALVSAGSKGGGALAALTSRAGALAGALGGVAAAAGAVALGKLAKDSLDAYASFEQLKGGVETLFGAGGQSIEEYAASVGRSVQEIEGEYGAMMSAQQTVLNNAAEAYRTAGISANSYMETVTSFSASLIQSVGGDTQKAAELSNQAIIDMSDNANKMGTSMEEIQRAYQSMARGNYAMLDSLKLGYGGTKAEMERLLADAEALSGVHYEMGNFADLVEAIHVIQTEMGITGTTAKEAATTIEGSVNSAKAAYQNWLVALADDNADIEALTTQLVESVGTAAENIVPRLAIIISSIATGLPSMLSGLMPIVMQAIIDIVNAIIAALPSLLVGILEVMNQLAIMIAEALPGLITTLVAAAAELLPMLIDSLTNMMVGIVEALPTIIQGIVAAIPTMITLIVNAIVTSIPLLIDGVIQLFAAIVAALPTIIQSLIAAIPTIVTAIVNALITALPTLINGFVQLFMAFVQALPQIIQTIVGMLPQLIDSITSTIIDALPLLLDAFIALFMAFVKALPTIIKTIVNVLPKLIDSITTTLVNALPLLVKAFLQLFMAFVKALPTIINTILKGIGQLISSMIKNLADAFPKFFNNAVEMFKNFLGGIQQKARDIFSFVAGIPGKILNALGNLGSKLFNAGSQIIQGFLKGITSAFEGVKNFIGGIGSWIANHKGPKEYDLALLIPNGQWIMQSLETGLKRGMPLIQQAVDDVTDMLGMIGSKDQTVKVTSEWDTMVDTGEKLARGLVVGFERYDPFTSIKNVISAEAAMLASDARGKVTNVYNNDNRSNMIFKERVQTPDEFSRALRMQQRYGLAVNRG